MGPPPGWMPDPSMGPPPGWTRAWARRRLPARLRRTRRLHPAPQRGYPGPDGYPPNGGYPDGDGYPPMRKRPWRRWRSTGRWAAAWDPSRPGARPRCWAPSPARSPRATWTSTSRCRSGFTPLDKTIGGGLRAGELLLIGGAQGTGKTTMAVQMARNIVMGGQASVLYVCYEHDEEYLLNRIIAMESALQHLPGRVNGVKLQDVRKEILSTWLAQGEGFADLMANPRLRPALERVNRYGPNLFLLRGSQTKNTVENLHAAGAALQGAVGRPAPGGLHRLHAEGAGHPRSADRGREGDLSWSTGSRTWRSRWRCP